MQKLIKLSDTHYIVVDDSVIQEGDFVYDSKDKVIRFVKQYLPDKWIKKITYSTQPLEFEWDRGVKDKFFDKIRPLSLSEVEEAIYGYSVENAAYHFCDNVVHPKDETWSLYFAFCTGFKTHQELVKDKLFTIEDMRKELTSLALEIATEDGQLSSCSPSLIYSWIENKIKTLLLPKTEWEVEFIDGKLKLKS